MRTLKYGIALTLFVLLQACSNEQTQESTTQEKETPKAKVVETANTAAPEKDQPTAKEDKAFAAFSFEETEHYFGEIKQGDIVKHTFNFTNIGDAPLLITDIKTTCGCTTPNYTREPVAPGESGEIEVQFNSAGKSGLQNKVITIYANTKQQRETISISTLVKVEKEVKGPYKVQ